MGNAFHGTIRRFVLILLPPLLCCAFLLLIATGVVFSYEKSMVEAKLIDFINEFYSGQDEVQVKFVNTIPEILKGKTKIKGINL